MDAGGEERGGTPASVISLVNVSRRCGPRSGLLAASFQTGGLVMGRGNITVEGRQDWNGKAVADGDGDFCRWSKKPTCSEAWNSGRKRAKC